MSAAVEHIPDYVSRGTALLIERYRLPRLSALLGAWLAEVQTVEDVLYALLTEGLTRQLDVLGRIVGQPREGRSDAVFLLWIRARVLVNRSSGRAPQLYAIVRAVQVPDPELEDCFPAAAIMHATTSYHDDGSTGWQVARLLQAAKPAGVALYFHWFIGVPFRFATGSSVEAGVPYAFDTGLWSSCSDGHDQRVEIGDDLDYLTDLGLRVTEGGENIWVAAA